MRKVQPVSFNLDDPYEKELLDHATDSKIFSKYVKRLIQADKERRERAASTKKAPAPSHVIHGGTNAFSGFKLES